MTRGQFFIAFCRACLRREGLAFLAFIGATAAVVVLSAFLAWNIRYLQIEKRSDDIAYLSFGLLVLFGIAQLSLHRLLGSRQALQVEFWKLKATMNQGEDPPGAGQ